jgi:suppressor for copper-sensitivity B
MDRMIGKIFGSVGLLLLLAPILAAQAPPPPPADELPAADSPFNVLDSFDPLGGGMESFGGQRVELTASYRMKEESRDGKLSVTARIQPGWHIYSLTQPTNGPQPTQILVASSSQFELTSEFRPDVDPDVHEDPAFPGVPVEEHRGAVTWTASIRLASELDPRQLEAEVTVIGQACQDGGACELIPEQSLAVDFAGFYQTSQLDGEFYSAGGHVTVRGRLIPGVAEPGSTIELLIQADIASGWHVYGYAETDPNKISKPTLIVLQKTSGWTVGSPEASEQPMEHEQEFEEEPIAYWHADTVSWTVPIQVPSDAQPGEYEISGYFAFQACQESACDPPTGLEFRGRVAVGAQSDDQPSTLSFASIDYNRVAEAAAVKAEQQVARESASTGGTWGDKSVLTVLTLAFLGGLILNVMPCVLPVIGLKIMSFVQQAGGSRWEIFSLNLWFSVGLLTVFWILASAAAFAGMGWGRHFGSVQFTVSMIGIVFAFGLSFLGVWEIPIPGFVGSGAMQGAAEHEGAIGAFSKGVFTTILATPCAGPLVVPAVSWAIGQPAWLTYVAFTAMGLGMASPYLLIGVFPRLINRLPKPGAWMDTFKQTMGFLLMGTVIFLMNSLQQQWIIPTLILLLGIGIGCWWLGKTPATVEFADRLKAWASMVLVIAASAVVGFVLLMPRHELAWQPFDRVALDKHLEEGRTVLVDFTADW